MISSKIRSHEYASGFVLRLGYRASDRRAVLSWEAGDAHVAWLTSLRRVLEDHTEDASAEGSATLSMPWAAFLSARRDFSDVVQGFQLRRGEHWDVESSAEELLRQSRARELSYRNAGTSLVDFASLQARLGAASFERNLTALQLRNVQRLASLPAGATFSVPGAGKTTEALATFFFRAEPSERLLVIAPKNAFGSWDEQLYDCVPAIANPFVRLRGGRERIAQLLAEDPRFMLITYQQLPRVRDLVAAHLAERRTYLFLDESHRIKSGAERQTPQAVLSMAHLPVGKLILSGTPMPQATDDLIPQLAFLYPEISIDTSNVVELIRPVYVRTNKRELGLPPVERRQILIEMLPAQAHLYSLMKSQVARDAEAALTLRNKAALRNLGRSVARLLQFVSNPALLAREIAPAHPELLASVLAEGDSPKLRYVVRRTRQLARQGHKVLVWSSFVANVEILAERLADIGAVYIHGGVDAGDEDDDDSREGKIRRFRHNAECRVLVANPAAASEGISLHTVCHHAIYLDRTFNAAHYLQSEDRIHRFGLSPDQSTVIEIVESPGTVDDVVRQRLQSKVARMANILEDSSLQIDAIPYDPPPSDDPTEEVVGSLGLDDAEALLRGLTA